MRRNLTHLVWIKSLLLIWNVILFSETPMYTGEFINCSFIIEARTNQLRPLLPPDDINSFEFLHCQSLICSCYLVIIHEEYCLGGSAMDIGTVPSCRTLFFCFYLWPTSFSILFWWTPPPMVIQCLKANVVSILYN